MATIAEKQLSSKAYYIAFCVALLPILLLRDFTPSNELRYLSIADEALRNGTFFTFYNHGLPYADKPPLYFWWIMLGKWLFGTHQMWFLTLASMVPALITTRVMERWVAPETDEDTSKIARMLLLTGGLFTGMVVTLRMDMLMCMFIVLSLRTFFTMSTSAEIPKREGWLFPLYIFLAVFSKGPFGLLIPLLSTVVYLLITGRIREMGRYWGWRTWVVLVFLFVVWFGCVYAEGGMEYLNNLVFHQTIDRAVDAFHHKEPFYYYGLSIWYSIAPWSLLLIPLMLVGAFKGGLRRDLERFFFVVFLTTFILLSCVSSKLQVYLLPAFPFVIYLGVLNLSRFSGQLWVRLLFIITATIFISALPLVCYFALYNADTAFLDHALIYFAAAIMTQGGVVALRNAFRAQGSIESGLCTLVYSLTCTIFLAGWALPSINPWIGYGALCQEAKEMAKEVGAEQYIAYGMHRPENMDAYLEQPIVIVEKEDVETIYTLPNAVVIMPANYLEELGNVEAEVVGPYAIIRSDELQQNSKLD